jgi:inosine-uridine nucleoside N-ribohydrolase
MALKAGESMKSVVVKTVTIFVVLAAACSAAMPVIFDSDLGNDVDDALALAMLHTLTDRGECKLIGVTLTNANPAAVPYVRMFNRFYGRESLPVGAAIRSLAEGDEDNYLKSALRSAPAQFKGNGDASAEPAVRVLRRLLAGSSEKVTIVQVGFSSNLAGLLDSKPDDIAPLDGVALIKEKVALLSAMAGNFAGGKREYNIFTDAPAARQLLDRWPVPIVFSGFEIGANLEYPATSIEKDFSYAEWHPVVASYRAFGKMPYDRPTWDLTSVLYAVRPGHGYFSLSENGRARVDASDLTPFTPGTDGRHRYLRLEQAQRARALEALMMLTSQPPHCGAGLRDTKRAK